MILALGGIALVSVLLFMYVHVANERLCFRLDLANTRAANAIDREVVLKRALQDLADSEIDRARFALEMLYGKIN